MRWIAVLVAFIVLAACASGGDLVVHSFGFDTNYDDQKDVEVLDYRYGNSKLPVYANEQMVKEGKVFRRGGGVSGEMLRGEFLFVKWRLKSTGAIYEEKVDLRHRLPANIDRCKVTFLIRGPQLYIYLVPPQNVKRPTGKPPNGPSRYDDLDTITIYPDSEATKRD